MHELKDSITGLTW